MEDHLSPKAHLAKNTATAHRLRCYRRIVYAVLALAACSALFAIAVWAALSAESTISVRGLL